MTDKDASVSDVVIPALTAATAEDVAAGDEIANVNLGKFKYVDQGANGASGKEGVTDKIEITNWDEIKITKIGESYFI